MKMHLTMTSLNRDDVIGTGESISRGHCFVRIQSIQKHILERVEALIYLLGVLANFNFFLSPNPKTS